MLFSGNLKFNICLLFIIVLPIVLVKINTKNIIVLIYVQISTFFKFNWCERFAYFKLDNILELFNISSSTILKDAYKNQE